MRTGRWEPGAGLRLLRETSDADRYGENTGLVGREWGKRRVGPGLSELHTLARMLKGIWPPLPASKHCTFGPDSLQLQMR